MHEGLIPDHTRLSLTDWLTCSFLNLLLLVLWITVICVVTFCGLSYVKRYLYGLLSSSQFGPLRFVMGEREVLASFSTQLQGATLRQSWWGLFNDLALRFCKWTFLGPWQLFLVILVGFFYERPPPTFRTFSASFRGFRGCFALPKYYLRGYPSYRRTAAGQCWADILGNLIQIITTVAFRVPCVEN